MRGNIMSESTKSNNRTLIVIIVILGAIIVVVGGYLIFTSLGPSDDAPATGGDEPRNPPATGAVTIQSFSLEPERITVGECVNLTWVVTNAETVTLSRDGSVIYNALMEDSYRDCLDQTGVFRYRVDASNSDGQFYNWSELQVIVE
jgi:hypothetical protein